MGRPRLLSKEQVLAAINGWIVKHGVPPTVEELRGALRLGSTRTVHRYLHWLEEAGDLERWPGARGVRPRRASGKVFQTKAVRIMGEAPAGNLMLAEENLEGWVRLPLDFLRRKGGEFFLLRVRGNSMNKARIEGGRIEDGDLVLVREQPTADDGDIVVALIDWQATIKRFGKGRGYYVLKPDSTDPTHLPIVLTEGFQVQGVVCRVLKRGSEVLEYQ